MTSQVLIFVLISVTLSSSAQLAMKFGMSRPAIQAALAGNDTGATIWAVATSLGVIGGLTLYGLSMLFWLWILSKIDVSQAYPFVSLGFLVIMIFAHLFLGESLGAQRVVGTLFVLAGVFLVANT